MNTDDLRPGSLLKLQAQFISTSFQEDGENDLFWEGDKIYPRDLMIYLGEDVVRFQRWARVFSSSHNRIGYVKLHHIVEVLR